MTPGQSLLLAIDTAADVAGVILLEDGELLAECTWRSRRNHSRELLPTIDWLLGRAGRDKTDLGAVAVCVGPGSYAGLRVGVSTAKALAYGLNIPLVGVGRLAADALPAAQARDGRVLAVHAAGRAELAWAAYRWQAGGLRELEAPRLGPLAQLLETVQEQDAIVAEAVQQLFEIAFAGSTGPRLVEASRLRVAAVARLGVERLQRGEEDDCDSLVPLYLRPPAIGPQ